jgi:hypothetical protein
MSGHRRQARQGAVSTVPAHRAAKSDRACYEILPTRRLVRMIAAGIRAT